jgi:hypothetical protein
MGRNDGAFFSTGEIGISRLETFPGHLFAVCKPVSVHGGVLDGFTRKYKPDHRSNFHFIERFGHGGYLK